ncbi:hypothetical protein SUGI_0079660 [Cryptomeria japonica]|nr:hypothetical protein SUGI_0079660 [Cryptomeria japonica]
MVVVEIYNNMAVEVKEMVEVGTYNNMEEVEMGKEVEGTCSNKEAENCNSREEGEIRNNMLVEEMNIGRIQLQPKLP